jgi:predicted dithiol-disulfide oxidoreductase (DUF899 family)
MQQKRIVSRDEWLAARKHQRSQEKEFTRLRNELRRRRRELPWVRVEKRYVFEGSDGPQTLADLFDGRSQLIVYHLGLDPHLEQGRPSCLLLADHIDGAVMHLARRDVALVAVSRAPLPEIETVSRRMGWRFKWMSSRESGFDGDYRMPFQNEENTEDRVYGDGAARRFQSEEMSGISMIYKDAGGAIFHIPLATGPVVSVAVMAAMVVAAGILIDQESSPAVSRSAPLA